MQLTIPTAAQDQAVSPIPCDDPIKADQYGVPLDQTTFSTSMARLQPFEDQPFLAIAVSGGADSLALTLLADRWARKRGGRAVGLTVDHGLRSGSAGEARQVGHWLAAKQIDHHILSWSGDKPTTGLQRKARQARYALLTDWCRQHRCLHLLTAHHRQDQAETVAIRSARQSGDAGLAAMAEIRELAGLRLLRPLLGIDKAALEAYLRAIGQPSIHDPSNDTRAYTRNRLRQDGLDIRALVGTAEKQGLRREEADERVAGALARLTTIDPAGFATLDAPGFNQSSDDLALAMLTRLLMTIGGNVYPPRQKALLRLFQAMRNAPIEPDRSPASWTLAHCRIVMHRRRWLICREVGNAERIALTPHQWTSWDNRFLIRLKKPVTGLVVDLLGECASLKVNSLFQKKKTRHLPGVVKAALPVIRHADRVVAVPHLGLFSEFLAPEDFDLRFYPPAPLANAPFKPHIGV